MNDILPKVLEAVHAYRQGQSDLPTAKANIEKELEQQKAEASAIEQSCAQDLLKGLATPSTNRDTQSTSAPFRHEFQPHPNILPLSDNCNGLVHGAILKGPNHTLVCQAFRWFEHQKILFGKRGCASWYTMIEEVAGVCDLFDASDTRIASWNTTTFFDQVYESTDVILPTVAAQVKNRFVRGTVPYNTTTTGFYASTASNQEEQKSTYNKTLYRYNHELADNSELDSKFYAHCRKHLLGAFDPVAQKTWLSDVECQLSTTGSDTFAIDTPFLKVYWPAGQQEVIVLLPEVCRQGGYFQAKVTGHEFDGFAKWHSKTFKL